MRQNEAAKGILFILPAFVLLVVILGFPAIAAVLQSFNLFWVERVSFTAAEYTGLVFDTEFRNAFSNTIGLVALVVAFHVVFGLAVALLLNLDLKAKWLFRVIALLPWTMPDVIAGLLWRFMFDTLSGVVNGVLLRVGALEQPFDFLGQPI